MTMLGKKKMDLVTSREAETSVWGGRSTLIVQKSSGLAEQYLMY